MFVFSNLTFHFPDHPNYKRAKVKELILKEIRDYDLIFSKYFFVERVNYDLKI